MFQRLFKGRSLTKKKLFSAWQIELTTRCPLRCRMCVREGFKDRHNSDMDIENFKKLIPYLRDVETVVLEGWGESLLHRNLIDIIRLVREAGPHVGFMTSGKALNREYIYKLIDSDVDFIGFSLAGASSRTHNSIRINSDFESLLESIKTLSDAKERKKLKNPKLHIAYLLLKDNISDVPALMKLARNIGINEVVLTNPIHITDEWQESQRVFTCNRIQEIRGSKENEKFKMKNSLETLRPFEELLKEAEIKAKEFKIILRRPSLSPIDTPVCEENPLRNLYISADGEVAPCVYLYPPTISPFKRIYCGNEYQLEKVSFGNIFRESFETIWNSSRYAEFREKFIIRKKRFEEMYSPFLNMERLKKFEIASLPEPPEQCRTCHKMLGV